MEDTITYLSAKFVEEIWPVIQLKISDKAEKNYFKAVRSICEFCQKDYLKLTHEDAVRYFKNMDEGRKEGKYTRNTIQAHLKYFRSISNTIAKNSAIFQVNGFENIFLHISIAKPEDYISPESMPSLREYDRLLEAAKKFDNIRFYGILTLVGRCALAVHEVCRLRVNQMIQSSDKVYIQFKEKRGTRNVLVPEDVDQIIKHVIEDRPVQGAYVFPNKSGKPLSARYLQLEMRECCRMAGTKNFTLQDLRNFAMAYMAKSGCPQSELARYTGIQGNWLHRLDQAIEEMPAPEAAEYMNIRIMDPQNTI